jgi:hypothetical protein
VEHLQVSQRVTRFEVEEAEVLVALLVGVVSRVSTSAYSHSK